MTAPADLAALDRSKYVRLTTFKRDGTAVHTPVWFAVDGDTIVVNTEAAAGKAKRIRNDGTVEVTVCDARGNVKDGVARRGAARILDDDDTAGRRRAHDLLNRKYGVVKKAFEVGMEANRLARRRPKPTEAVIEIRLDPAA